MLTTFISKSQLLSALHRQGIDQLSPMQQDMWNTCSGKENVVLLSPTGSGKTLAFLLPLCGQIDIEADAVQVIIVVPSRELAIQIEEVLHFLRIPVRSTCCYGGRSTMEEHRVIRQNRPHIIVATPGRLTDHLKKGNISTGNVHNLVIDEFDKCFELGFREEICQIVDSLPANCRYVLTSATESDELDSFMSAKRGGLGSAVTLNYLADKSSDKLHNNVRTYVVHSKCADKLEALKSLLYDISGHPAIVFVNHRESVERIGGFLEQAGFYAEQYHGGMEQLWRERAVYKFRSGCSNVLVATDLASRGLDIPEVEAVVHYHLPANREVYIHRSGRTGRWESEGRSYLILGPRETLPDYVEATSENYVPSGKAIRPIAPRWQTLYIGKGKKDKISKMDIVGFFCKKGGLRSEDIGRIDVKDRYAYVAVHREKIRNVLRAVAGEKIKGVKTLIEIMRH